MAIAENRALTPNYMSSAFAQLIPKYARFSQGAKAGSILARMARRAMMRRHGGAIFWTKRSSHDDEAV
jgi:hypothetical protein